MKTNGIIKPDVSYDVPEHTSMLQEKIGYFLSEDEARKFAKAVNGNITIFSAKVQIEGEYYSATVKYPVEAE